MPLSRCAQGPKDQAEITCKNCGAESTITRSNLRCVTFPKSPDEADKPKKVGQARKHKKGCCVARGPMRVYRLFDDEISSSIMLEAPPTEAVMPAFTLWQGVNARGKREAVSADDE
jgi:hypothetical protein